MNKYIMPYATRISECTLITYFFVLSFFPFSAGIIKLLCLLTVIGCWMARMISEKKILFIKTPLNISIVSFFLWSLVAAFPSVSIKHSLDTIFHDYFTYFIIFFGMINTIHDQEQIKRIVKTLLVTCGLVCAYGIYGYYTGIAIRDERLVSTFGYHTLIAEYISLLLPIALCLFFWYRGALARLCLALLIVVYGFSLILTMTRTSWVAVLCTMIFIGFAVQRKFLIFVFTGICALAICIMPSKYLTHVKTITQVNKFSESEEILGQRLLCWKASIAMAKDHPIFGIGPSNRIFRETYQQYAKKIENEKEQNQQKDGMASEQYTETKITKKSKATEIQRLSNAHNIFLHILVETGVVGLLIFLWLFISVFYSAVKSWQSLSPGYEKALLLGIIASLISIFLEGLMHNFWKKPDALFLWYIIGILFTVIHNVRRNTIKQ